MAKSSEILLKLGKLIIDAMRKDINDNTSSLSKSLKYKVEQDLLGSTLSVEMLAYGQYVDTGTRGTKTGLSTRKMPPIKELNHWASSKGINIWALAKSIQMYGTKAHPFIYNFEDVIIKHKQILIDAFGYDIDHRVRVLLQDSAK